MPGPCVVGPRSLGAIGCAAAQVLADHGAGWAIGGDLSVTEVDGALAKRLDGREIVADEDDRASAARDLADLAEAFLLKLGVAHRENLVDEQNLRLEVRRDREGETEIHPARVPLHRRVEEGARSPAKATISSKLRCDLAARHADDHAVQVDVLATGELGMEARPDLQQRSHAAAERACPPSARRCARES